VQDAVRFLSNLIVFLLFYHSEVSVVKDHHQKQGQKVKWDAEKEIFVRLIKKIVLLEVGGIPPDA
jgi:hypothetical protein